jgi:hypothetical protein
VEHHLVGSSASAVGDLNVQVRRHRLRHVEVHTIVVHFKMRFLQTADRFVGSIAFVIHACVGRPVKVFQINIEWTAFWDSAISAGTDNVRRQSDYVTQTHVDWIVTRYRDSINSDDFHGIYRVVRHGKLPWRRCAHREY